MFASSKTPARPLPQPQLSVVRPGISLLKPLSHRGDGPGLIVLCPDATDPLAISNGVPWPLVKWAEEGYAVAEIQAQAVGDAASALRDALKALADCDNCTQTAKVGLVGVCLSALVQSKAKADRTAIYSLQCNAVEQRLGGHSTASRDCRERRIRRRIGAGCRHHVAPAAATASRRPLASRPLDGEIQRPDPLLVSQDEVVPLRDSVPG